MILEFYQPGFPVHPVELYHCTITILCRARVNEKSTIHLFASPAFMDMSADNEGRMGALNEHFQLGIAYVLHGTVMGYGDYIQMTIGRYMRHKDGLLVHEPGDPFDAIDSPYAIVFRQCGGGDPSSDTDEWNVINDLFFEMYVHARLGMEKVGHGRDVTIARHDERPCTKEMLQLPGEFDGAEVCHISGDDDQFGVMPVSELVYRPEAAVGAVDIRERHDSHRISPECGNLELKVPVYHQYGDDIAADGTAIEQWKACLRISLEHESHEHGKSDDASYQCE